MSDALFGRRERLAFVAGALILGAIVLASIWLAINTVRNLDEAEHSQAVRAMTIDLLEAVTSAETGQRGYLLTGKPAYLAPYEDATRRVPVLLDRLSVDLAGNADFRDLREQAGRKLVELGRTVALAQAGQRDAALDVVRGDLGEQLMVSIRDLARRLTESERIVLGSDIGRSKAGAETVVAVDIAAFVLLLALTAVIVGGARRYVAQLRAAQEAAQAANAELGRSNERLEAAVLERTADLSRANEEIQTFAYIVSHDLRAPLLNIIGFTSELEDAAGRLRGFVEGQLTRAEVPVPPPVREACEKDLPEAIRFIQSSTTKMDRLINAILRLSREGRRVLVPERLDTEAMLGAIIDSLRHQAEQAGAEVTVEAAPTLVSDRLALEQIFSNLLENALKYLKPGRPGRVSVRGVREGAWIVFRVRDNGRGIAPRDRERVFQLFRRAGTQNVPGEGIGLAHVRALARRLGGTVDCESEPDVGSEFILHLPAVLAYAEDVKR